MVLVDGRTRREERHRRLSVHQLVGQVVVVIVVCPCGSTSCPGMLLLSPSVRAPAGWPSHRHHCPSLHQLGAWVVVVCPCSSTSCPGMSLPSVCAPAGWPSRRRHCLSLARVVVIVVVICPCSSTSCPATSSSSLSVRVPVGWPSCRPHLSRGSSLPSSSSSVLAATQVIVVVCPVAHRHRLSHHRSITITITVYPCASYPSHRRCHRRLSHGSLLASAHGSGRHHSLPLWLIVVIVVVMVGGDSWDWCWRWWHWLVSGSVCAFVMAGSLLS